MPVVVVVAVLEVGLVGAVEVVVRRGEPVEGAPRVEVIAWGQKQRFN